LSSSARRADVQDSWPEISGCWWRARRRLIKSGKKEKARLSKDDCKLRLGILTRLLDKEINN